MSKNFTDEMIDSMLNDYFSRKPNVVFSADLDMGKRSVFDMKRSLVFKSAAVCACFAVLAVGIFSAVRGHSASDEPASGNYGNTLVLTAYAADVGTSGNWNANMKTFPGRAAGAGEFGGVYYSEEPVYYLDDNPDDNEKSSLMGEELEQYLESGESSWNGYDVIEKKDASFETYCINLNIDGENILTYDVECETGEVFCYSVADCEDTVNLPFDGEHFVAWCAGLEKIGKEVFSEIEGGIVTAGTVDRHIEAMRNALQTAEDYTYYFGDTITVTAHFEDGTTQTSHINITLDADGNYIINYL